MADNMSHKIKSQNHRSSHHMATERSHGDGNDHMNDDYYESTILTSFADMMRDAIVMVDWNGSILYANRSAAQLVGLKSVDEGIGLNMLNFIHPDSRDSVIRDLHLIKEGKRRFDTDYRIYKLITNQKEEKWVEALGTKVTHQGKTVDLVTMRDVTDRKKAEDLLVRERKAFSIITDASLKESTDDSLCYNILSGLTETLGFDYGIVRLYDETNQHLYVTSTVGITDELPDTRFPPVLLDDNYIIAASVARKREPIFAPDISKHPIYTTHRKRIDDVGFSAIISWPMIGSDQNLLGVIHLMSKNSKDIGEDDRSFFETVAGMFAIVLERRKMEEELKQAEEKYRTIFENATIGIFQTTPDGRFISANTAMARSLGYDSSEEMLMSVKNIGEELYGDPSRRAEYLRLLNEHGHVEDFEVEGYRKDGNCHWFALTAQAVRDAEGRIHHYEGTARSITKRKMAEKALKESEEKYRTIFETTGTATVIIEEDTTISLANTEFENLTGYARYEVEGKMRWTEFVTPQCIIEMKKYHKMRRVDPHSVPRTYEYQLIDKHGVIKDISAVVDMIPGTKQSIVSSTDVTIQKRAESLLKKSEEQYRTLMEEAPIGFCTIDLKGKIAYINRRLEELTGYTRELLIGKNGFTLPLFDDETKHIIAKRLEERIKGNAPQTIEVSLRNKNGTISWIEVTARIIEDKGLPAGFQIACRDITDRKKAEEALRQSEERYRAIFETTGTATIIYGEDTIIQMANTELANLFGYTKEEIEGKKSWTEFIFHEDLPRMQAYHEQRGGDPTSAPKNYEFRFRDRFGNIKNIFLTVDMIPGTSLRVGSLLDITDLKRLEAQLQRSRKMEALGTLAGGVAHDLNNVLGGLVSYPELLLMQIPDDSSLRKPIATIQKSGQKAAAIVQDLLTLARRGVSITEVISLNQILSDYLKTPEHDKLIYFHPGITIKTNLDESLLNIEGSPIHLSKTIMNLISNAAEAMPGGGPIVISTENRYIDKPIRGYDNVEEGDYAVLTVSDTGIGISTDDLDRIFEPFYTKKVMGRSGTGLGMAVVWGTVKDHNGYIDVQSTEGMGTTFTLFFPVTRKKTRRAPVEREALSYKGKGEAILVVDDIQEQREIAAQMLERLGYSVTAVSSGEEAVAFMKDHSVGLVVLDMIMDPGIDGLETYRQILTLHPNQKAIIVSGFSETRRVRKLQKLGAGEYVKKPYLMEKLGIAVRDELDRD